VAVAEEETSALGVSDVNQPAHSYNLLVRKLEVVVVAAAD